MNKIELIKYRIVDTNKKRKKINDTPIRLDSLLPKHSKKKKINNT